MFTPELEAEERRHQWISGTITTILMVILMLLSLLYTVYRERVPPPGERYEVLGAIDFGDLSQGSRNINNFERAVPDPVDAPVSEPEAQPEPTPPQPSPAPTPTPPSPTPTPPVTTPAPSPVTTPEVPKPSKPDPTPSPPEATEEPEPARPSRPSPRPSPRPTPSSGGSNHGNADSGTGNAGTPDAKNLDPNGLYTFGTGGDGGLKGRNPVALPYPAYSVQEEGTLEFEFVIDAQGNVQYVKLVGVTDKIGLKEAGINAISRWKFTPSPGAGAQRVRVKIKFQLKG